jgi:hypothetical protein
MKGRLLDLTGTTVPSSGWLQYRVDFISPDGGLSPSLSEVTIRFR